MVVLAVGIIAAALMIPPDLPVGEPVTVRLPDYRAEVQRFEASPPFWNEGLVNVGWGAARGDFDRRAGWLRKNWIWLDAVDRSADSPAHGFLAHRGVFYDVYGYNEYQETLFVRESGALDLLTKHGGIARMADGGLELHERFSTDAQKAKHKRGNVYLADHLDSRWAAIVGYDWLTSPLLGDGISQDNIGMTVPKNWTWGSSAEEKFRHVLEGDGELPRFLAKGGSVGRYLSEEFLPRGEQEGWAGPKGIDSDAVRNDPVLSAYYRFQVIANLYQFSQHYEANKLVASRVGRLYDVHGNQGGFVTGFDPYAVLLGDFVDSIWFESRGFSSRDLFEKRWANAWGPFRFQMGDAMSGGRKPVLIMSREGTAGPELQAHAYAEASAGGGALMSGPAEDRDDSESLAWLDAFFDFRDRNRALFEIKGRERYSQVAVLYSLPTFLWDHAVPEFKRSVTNDLGGVTRALEESQVPYDLVILGMAEIRKDTFLEKDLRKYKVVIAPSVSALSDAQVAKLAQYGADGGTLVVVGDLGTRNERGGLRKTAAREALRSASFVTRPLVSQTFPSSRRTESPELQEQWTRFSEAVRKAVARPLLEGELPRWTWVKTWLHRGDLFSAHFVNYDFDFEKGKMRPASPARISIRLPPSVEAEEVSWRVPGQDDQQLQVERTADGISLQIPSLDIYGVLVVGRKREVEKANALSRGDRYLLRARIAGKPISGLDARIAAVEAKREEGRPLDYADAAKRLLVAISYEREADYVGSLEIMATPKDPVLALDFGARDDHGVWKALGGDDAYRASRGFGWLASEDASDPTPEEREYIAASKMEAQPNEISKGKLGGWPHVKPAPMPLRTNLYSGRRQRLRLDVPPGRYRVDLINSHPSGSRRNFFVSGATWANGEAVLFDVPINRGEVTERSFTAEARENGLALEFGAATGWGVAALVVRRAKDGGSAAVEARERGGVRSWRLSPRYPNPRWVPLEELVPLPSAQLAAPPIEEWTLVEGPAQGLPIINLGTTKEADPGDVVYASTVLERAQAQTVQLHLGSTSSAEVWLNGRRMASVPNVKGIERNEAVVELPLKKGRNALVISLQRFWERRWMFYASLTPGGSEKRSP